MKLSQRFSLEPEDNQCLSRLCGPFNENLTLIANRLNVKIKNRGHEFTVMGEQTAINSATDLLLQLYEDAKINDLAKEKIHLALSETNNASQQAPSIHIANIKSRGPNQTSYLNNIQTHDLTFGIGPAGTGKTFIAVACAAHALEKDQVERIILVRPAVEAGEKLGFLPGDMAEKIDPYLRPLYDALSELLGPEKVNRLIDKEVIEVAPLAYMRGRTLNNAFIILDESQNTTVEQMKMFLTRIGFGSKAVVTGDVTQIDLPKHQRSGLIDVIDVLRHIEDINFSFFNAADVVRHPIVQNIIDAYDQHEHPHD